jgi:hypothetical protein
VIAARIAEKFSRTRRSTKLSHSPKWISHASMPNRRARYFAYVAADSKEIEPNRSEQGIAALVSSTEIK